MVDIRLLLSSHIWLSLSPPGDCEACYSFRRTSLTVPAPPLVKYLMTIDLSYMIEKTKTMAWKTCALSSAWIATMILLTSGYRIGKDSILTSVEMMHSEWSFTLSRVPPGKARGLIASTFKDAFAMAADFGLIGRLKRKWSARGRHSCGCNVDSSEEWGRVLCKNRAEND